MQENTEGMSADSKENKFKVGDKVRYTGKELPWDGKTSSPPEVWRRIHSLWSSWEFSYSSRRSEKLVGCMSF